jgi:phage FluMu protein Com
MSTAYQWTDAAAVYDGVSDDTFSHVVIEMVDVDRVRDLGPSSDDGGAIAETGTVAATASVQASDANDLHINHIGAHIEPETNYDWLYTDRSSGLHEDINEVDLRSILAALGDNGDPEQFVVSQMRLMMSISTGIPVTEAQLAELRPPRECAVCFETVPLSLRLCCRQPVCDGCIRAYVEMQLLDNGKVQIGCPNPACDKPIYNEEIRVVLSNNLELRDRYDKWIVDMNGNPNRKTCPRCSRITELDEPATSSTAVQPAANRKSATSKYGQRVQCVECQLEWCFPCQAPWHEGLTCKAYRAGDVLLKDWAKQKPRAGERNAQKCPKCKVGHYFAASQCDL